jgi:hypothetical protein
LRDLLRFGGQLKAAQGSELGPQAALRRRVGLHLGDDPRIDHRHGRQLVRRQLRQLHVGSVECAVLEALFGPVHLPRHRPKIRRLE